MRTPDWVANSVELLAVPPAPGWRYWPLLVWAGAIFILSSIPGYSYPEVKVAQADKIVHFLLYLPGGVLITRAFSPAINSWYEVPRVAALRWWAYGTAYGISDEIHQLFVPFRNFSYADMAVDALAIGAGIGLWFAFSSSIIRCGKPLDAPRPPINLRAMPIVLEPAGILIVLSSPSGGGKSTICRALLSADPQLDYSISVTSRPKRGHEVEGEDYNFVSAEEFHRLISEDVFYGWARVHDNFYGTRRDIVDAKLAAGKDVVMDLDVNGSLSIKKLNDTAVLIFVLPPSLFVLEERLRKRNTDQEDVIRKRLVNARYEINFAQKYDYVVVNRDLEQTIQTIRKIIDAERHSSKHQKVLITGEDSVTD